MRITILFVVSTQFLLAQSATFRWVHEIGGSSGQTIAGIAADSQGNTYVVGNTSSLDLAVRNAQQPVPGGSGLFRVDGVSGSWNNLYQSGVFNGYAVAADRRDPNRVYAGTATSIVLSRDLGATWTVAATPGVRINAITIDPTNGSVLYAATAGNGLLKSSDAGVTWSSINNGIPADSNGQRYAFGIWVDPIRPSSVFASVWQTALLHSTDSGATWATLAAPGIPDQVGDLAFDPFRPATLYASNGRTAATSADGGLTWNAIARLDEGSLQATHILPDPKKEGVLYATNSAALFKSVDRGATWTVKSRQPGTALTLDPVSGAMYALLGNRLVVTTDGFDTTTIVGPSALVYGTAIAASGGHLFVATQGGADVFVAKLDPQGNTVFSTYFGGSGQDLARAMAVDAAGNVYVTGITQSPDFPFTKGAYSTDGPVFVFKLNADGSLAYSTGFMGGTPNAIAVDSAGRAFVTGITTGGLPVTSGAYQTKFDGVFCSFLGCLLSIPVNNGFLTEFDAAGASLVFSTYLGKQNESGNAVAVLADGSPVVGGVNTMYRLDPSGSTLLAKAAFAGIRTLTTDGKGNLLAAGASQDPLFPATPGAFQTALYPLSMLPGTLGNTGSGDAYVARFDPELTLLNATLLGGESSDVALAVAALPNGAIVAGGSTYSKAFPSRGAAQGSFAPATGFVSQLTSDLSALTFSTFTGDNRLFFVRSVAATPDGGIIFAGTTAQAPYFSFDALYPAADAHAFVVRVEPLGAVAPRIDSVVNAASQLGVPLSSRETIQVHGDGFGDDVALTLNGEALPILAHDRTTVTTAAPAGFHADAATLELRSGAGAATILLRGASASPGIFAIVNKDGTLNSPSNPTKEGEPITIYATGVGTMTFDQGYAVTDAVVDVRVDGFSAAGIAAVLGPVPGFPGDVYQISVYVPHPVDFVASNPNLKDFVMPPTVAVTLIVNDARSQAGVPLSVGPQK